MRKNLYLIFVLSFLSLSCGNIVIDNVDGVLGVDSASLAVIPPAGYLLADTSFQIEIDVDIPSDYNVYYSLDPNENLNCSGTNDEYTGFIEIPAILASVDNTLNLRAIVCDASLQGVLTKNVDYKFSNYEEGWKTVIQRSVSNGDSSYLSFGFGNSDLPYVLFRDWSEDYKPVLMELNESNHSWDMFAGVPIVDANVKSLNPLFFDSLKTPHVLLPDPDDGNRGLLKKINSIGDDWDVVGGDYLTTSSISGNLIQMSSIDKPYVFLVDGKGSPWVLKRLNSAGDAWETIGTSFSGVSNFSFKLNSLDISYVAYNDSSNNIYVQKINAAEDGWDTIGGGPVYINTSGYLLDFELDSTGTPYVALKDNLNSNRGVIRKLNLAGDAWETVADNFFTDDNATNSSLYFDASDVPYILSNDDDVAKLVLKKPNIAGDAWELVGTEAVSKGQGSSSSLKFDSSNIPYVVFIENSNGDRTATLKKLNGTGDAWDAVGTGPVSSGEASEASFDFDSTGSVYVLYGDVDSGGKVMLKNLGMKVLDPQFSETSNELVTGSTLDLFTTTPFGADIYYTMSYISEPLDPVYFGTLYSGPLSINIPVGALLRFRTIALSNRTDIFISPSNEVTKEYNIVAP